ncbi:MAG TPA: hypothetical protein VFC06_06835 [Demequina sp.]|nr:hypothetical protein [Demequina sp.]
MTNATLGEFNATLGEFLAWSGKPAREGSALERAAIALVEELAGQFLKERNDAMIALDADAPFEPLHVIDGGLTQKRTTEEIQCMADHPSARGHGAQRLQALPVR